jgi:hypothetical protein
MSTQLTTESMEALLQQNRDTQERVAAATKTNYGQMATIAALMLSVVLYHSSLIMAPVNQYIQNDNARYERQEQTSRENNDRWAVTEREYSSAVSELHSLSITTAKTLELQNAYMSQELSMLKAKLDMEGSSLHKDISALSARIAKLEGLSE